MPTNTLLLNKAQVLRKVRRIAFEIYERNYQEKELVFAGIDRKGYLFAQLLKGELQQVSPIKIRLVKVRLDKKLPLQSEITLDCSDALIQNKTVILIDDVLNTGKTLAYSLKPFLNIEVKKLETAVIVDREHSLFPISASYVGYSLSTTLQEHIEIELEDETRFGVYLK